MDPSIVIVRSDDPAVVDQVEYLQRAGVAILCLGTKDTTTKVGWVTRD